MHRKEIKFGKTFISKGTNHIVSPTAAYTIVMKNYHNIWEHLGCLSQPEEGDDLLDESEKGDIEKENSEFGTDFDSLSSEEVHDNKLLFTITLSPEEYKDMKPEDRV